MPRLAELRKRFQTAPATHHQDQADAVDECLVFDPRNGLTPKQLVERKLGSALLRECCQSESSTMFFRTKPR
jgi:hypothetical protein